MDLKDSVALVTGASRGIGKAIALTLAQNGSRVVLAGRDVNALNQVSRSIDGFGRKSLVVKTDMTRENEIRKLVETSLKEFQKVDILVNNAGIGIFNRVTEMKLEDWDEMFNVNIRGVYLATKFVLPSMMEKKQGYIVNIASLAAKNAMVGGTGYFATKWALRGFAQSLMLEVREHNIKVVTVFPGSVATEFSDGRHGDRPSEKILHPQDVADAVVAAVKLPNRAMMSEIDLRPTNPK